MLVLPGHRKRVNALAFSTDGNLVSGGADATVRAWDLATSSGKVLVQNEKALFAEYEAVAFSGDGQHVLSTRTGSTYNSA